MYVNVRICELFKCISWYRVHRQLGLHSLRSEQEDKYK